ncbi:MAG: protein-tyrosine phosphatase [Cyclobacteriaceae bacterium]|jgi:protein-tyrosine phosphatase
MFDWINSRKKLNLTVDIHSHLLPGLDDGVKSFDESIEILQNLQSFGYKKVITTPHIYPEVYPNTPAGIAERFDILSKKIKTYGISIELEFAAEYQMDSLFLETIKSDAQLLSFGEGYVLFETSFYSKPLIFNEVIFELQSKGYTPVFAHPERYHYLEKDLSWLRSLHSQGVKLQVNLPSLVGAYGDGPKKTANRLLDASMVSFLGSDIHRANQVGVLRQALQQKIKENVLLNNSLL